MVDSVTTTSTEALALSNTSTYKTAHTQKSSKLGRTKLTSVAN